jgi:hypothetical protein
MAVQDHAEQNANTAPIGLDEKVRNLGQDRPGSDQAARKAASELHCAHMIRVARVDQGE